MKLNGMFLIFPKCATILGFFRLPPSGPLRLSPLLQHIFVGPRPLLPLSDPPPPGRGGERGQGGGRGGRRAVAAAAVAGGNGPGGKPGD